mgnify:CR=1 FL=1
MLALRRVRVDGDFLCNAARRVNEKHNSCAAKGYAVKILKFGMVHSSLPQNNTMSGPKVLDI